MRQLLLTACFWATVWLMEDIVLGHSYKSFVGAIDIRKEGVEMLVQGIFSRLHVTHTRVPRTFAVHTRLIDYRKSGNFRYMKFSLEKFSC